MRASRNRRPVDPPELSESDRDRLHNTLRRFVCSDPWHATVYAMVLAGRLPFRRQRKSQEHVISRAQVYPPGGTDTAMKRCNICGRWTPPQAVMSSGACVDCLYCSMPTTQWAALPSSHRFEWAVPDADLPAHVTGFRKRRSKRSTCRLDDEVIYARRVFCWSQEHGYHVLEERADDQGFRVQTVIPLPECNGSENSQKPPQQITEAA
jgi:hypothetical protein